MAKEKFEIEGIELLDEVAVRKGGRSWDDIGLKNLINTAMQKAREANKKAVAIKFDTILKFYSGNGDDKYTAVRIKRKIMQLTSLPAEKISMDSRNRRVIIQL